MVSQLSIALLSLSLGAEDSGERLLRETKAAWQAADRRATEAETKADACEKRVSELEAELAKIRPSPGPAGPVASGGYKNSKWGMTKAQVKKLFPGVTSPKGEPDVLVKLDKLNGKPISVGFVFVDGKLVRVALRNRQDFVNKNGFLNIYEDWFDLLSTKYGAPAENETAWGNDLYRDDPEDWGMAVSVGHLTRRAAWIAGDTKVTLGIFGERFDVMVGIDYTSTALAGAEDRAQEKQALDDL